MWDKSKIINFALMTKNEVELPLEFLEEISVSLGPEEARLLSKALEERPSVSIRINKAKVLSPDSFLSRFAHYAPSGVPWCKNGFYLESRPEFILDPLLHAGTYYVQEAASMYYETIVEGLLRNFCLKGKEPLKVLDLCAAPGGKSTAILNALAAPANAENCPTESSGGSETPALNNYVLVANEYERSRAGILRENLNKWGDPNIIITSTGAGSLGKLEDFFDIVAVDAPCSGEGMMRREPIACTQWSPRLVAQCSALQKDILADILPALKPGGFLIYSTCTFNKSENEENVGFLQDVYGLELLGQPRRFMPHREKCEGLFVAVFRKPDYQKQESFKRTTGKNKQKKIFINAPGNGLFINSENLKFIEIGERVFALPPAVEETYLTLVSEKIHPISAGVETGTMKGKLFVPSSRQVLSSLFDAESLPVVELTKDEAVNYLRRQPLILPADTSKGYVCVVYDGHPLGLLKNIGNRSNNLYPQEWRIRK